MAITHVTCHQLLSASIFLIAFLLFLVAFATPSWLEISDGMQAGLWTQCCMIRQPLPVWECEAWQGQYIGFVTASQAFATMALLLYIGIFVAKTLVVVSLVMQVPYLKNLEQKCVLMILVICTFSCGCLGIMSAVVMGVKGSDYVEDLHRNDFKMFAYSQRRIDLQGELTYGWSFAVTVVASCLAYVSCAFLALDYKILPDLDEGPTDEV